MASFGAKFFDILDLGKMVHRWHLATIQNFYRVVIKQGLIQLTNKYQHTNIQVFHSIPNLLVMIKEKIHWISAVGICMTFKQKYLYLYLFTVIFREKIIIARMFYLIGLSTNICSVTLTLLLIVAFWFATLISSIWDKVFKKRPSKICGRQPLKNLKGYGLLKQTISLKIS